MRTQCADRHRPGLIRDGWSRSTSRLHPAAGATPGAWASRVPT